MKLWTLCLALGMLMAQPKETPPLGSPPIPFNVPQRETYSLKNGMKITLVPYGTVPLVTVRAVVGFGNLNESAQQVWLADMVAALLKEGAAGLNGQQLAEAAARMGGQLSVNAGADNSAVGVNVLSEFAPDAVKLVSDVLLRPTFPASELERIRANLLRRVALAHSEPQALASEAFSREVYGNHPYGREYPTEAQLKAYTLDDVKKFFAANAGARRTHLYIAGRFDSSVRKAIAAAFDGWQEGPAVVRNVPKMEAKRTVVLIDRPGAAQSTLRIGLPLAAQPANADYIPMEVTDSILGGSFGSRITSNIREQKGYTYSPYSSVDTNYHTAVWSESADVTTKVTGESLKEIFYEIDRLRKTPPSEQELKNIQNYLSGVFIIRNSSANGLAGRFAFVDEQGLTDDYLRTYVQKVNAVTRADVQRIAEQYLNPEKMTIVVVGDKSQVEGVLKPYQPK